MSSSNIERKFKKLANMSWSLKKALVHGSWTVVRHAKHIVPVDTGDLRASINYEIRDYTSIIFAGMEYAEKVEKGLGQRPQPYLKPAITRERDDIVYHIEKEIKENLKRAFR